MRQWNLSDQVHADDAADVKPIRLQGRLQDPVDFRDLIVRAQGDQLIRLRQVADVEDGAEEVRSLASFNRQRAIGLDVLKTKESSTTTESDRVKAQLEDIRRELPQDVTIDVLRDAGERVLGRVGSSLSVSRLSTA